MPRSMQDDIGIWGLEHYHEKLYLYLELLW